MNQYNKDGSQPDCYAEVYNTVPSIRTPEYKPDGFPQTAISWKFEDLVYDVQYTETQLKFKSLQTIAIWRITLKK
jgi:hypothetical protein